MLLFIVLAVLLGGLLWTAAIALWVLGRARLRAADLGAFDAPVPRLFSAREMPSSGQQATLDRVREFLSGTGAGARARKATRQRMDAMADRLDIDAKFRPVEVGKTRGAEVRGGEVRGEWVLAPGADPSRRLLYVHGGGFMLGSPRSHRFITSELSRRAGAAVFAVDYRLMPEKTRAQGIADCRACYLWILENGPEGRATLDSFFVAGDSAGGNLTLMLIAWAREKGHRPVDAAVALSPATDSTLGSPSFRTNLPTDPVLGPAFKRLHKVPRTVAYWLGWLFMRRDPASPDLSPALGKLRGLPPILVQASQSEVLRDDAVRYVNKAVAAGSPASIQLWPNMVHVWQMFGPELEETEEALAEIGTFLERHAPRAEASRSAAG